MEGDISLPPIEELFKIVEEKYKEGEGVGLWKFIEEGVDSPAPPAPQAKRHSLEGNEPRRAFKRRKLE